MEKVVIFAFRGEAMCFIHVLINAIDMDERKFDVKIVIEGEATRLLKDLSDPGSILYGPFEKAKGRGLIAGVCRACSEKMGTYDIAISMGLNILEDIAGHPSMGKYIEQGYKMITM